MLRTKFSENKKYNSNIRTFDSDLRASCNKVRNLQVLPGIIILKTNKIKFLLFTGKK